MRSGQVKALTILANTAATAREAALLVEKMEERVAERTSELRAANEELDAFSHSVSHDLRAPLRAVEGYCEMLLDEHSAALPKDTQRLLGQVHQGAQRMHTLIRDLLSFSRSAREPMENRQVNLQALANGVWDELRSSAPATTVQISIGALPEIIGDIALLRQVFVNLLSNAVKYSQHRSEPKIEVGAAEDPQNPRNFLIFVRDNGAGFDMRHVDRLFGVFQRLHEPSEFEGTGVGLSIVRRIVTRHGGRVWAEGRPDEGATFYFTLPKALPKEADSG
jgi:light-regulated signal transduction histidine kinase (bacteriophytochrome)